MPKQNFVAGTTPTIGAVWLNKIDTMFVDAFAEAQTAAGVRSALGATTVGDAIFRAANAAAVRTAAELIAGGAGDIWVEKAGDTMTGALNVAAPLNVTGTNDVHFAWDLYLDRAAGAFLGFAGDGRISVASGKMLRFSYDDGASFAVRLNAANGLVWVPSSSVSLSENGQIAVEFTNNTTLTFKGKGTDGTVRSATLTLA